jgi:hypothetical protein
MRDMAAALGRSGLADEADRRHGLARATLNDAYWRESEGHHAFGILTSGRTNDNLTVWPATAAAFGLLETGRAVRTLTKLAADSISADWGARMLSTGSPLYDPMHYNNGAVWPFVTGFVAWGQYNYRRAWAGFPLIDAVAQLTFDWARGRHPELLSGRLYRPLDAAVPQQFFATSMLVSPVLYGLLGWEPDAPRGRARLAPQLPPLWPHVRVRNLRVGESRLTVRLEQSADRVSAALSATGPDVRVDLSLPLPGHAHDVRYVLNGASEALDVVTGDTPLGLPPAAADRAAAHVERSGVGDAVRAELVVSGEPQIVTVSWAGGLRVAPLTVNLDPGQASHGARILAFTSIDERRVGWRLTVEGPAGSQHDLALSGERVRVSDGPATLDLDTTVHTLTVTLPPGSGRTTATITLTSEHR